MVNYGSHQAYLLAGVESSYNTPVSTTKDLGITSGVSVTANNNPIEVRSIGNREPDDIVAGNFDANISIDGTLNSGAIFELFFGQSTDAATSTDYKHTFIDDDGSEVLKDTVTSFTLSENYNSTSDVTHTWGGCVVNTLDVNIAVNEVVTISSEILAADEDTGTSAGTQVTTTTVPFSFAQCNLSVGAQASEVILSQVKSFNISFNNNIDLADIRGIGSRLSLNAVPKNFEMTGEFTVTMTDKTLSERFLGSSAASTSTPTDSGLIFQATNGVVLGSGRTEFYVRLYGVQFESVNRVVGENIVEETFTFRGTTLKDCFVVDSVSSYF